MPNKTNPNTLFPLAFLLIRYTNATVRRLKKNALNVIVLLSL